VRRLLFEVDSRRLQFSASEAALLFRDRLGRELPARQLQPLLEKTKGWPAALERVAMALAQTTHADRFVDRFTGTASASPGIGLCTA
jgi:ATP/maltotriose-dependent transcriptional regulator MalT